jgi:hypothetical protein
MNKLKFQRLKVLESGKIVTRLGTIIAEAHGRRLVVLKTNLNNEGLFITVHSELIKNIFFKAGSVSFKILENGTYDFSKTVERLHKVTKEDLDRWENSAGAKNLAIELTTKNEVKEWLA